MFLGIPIDRWLPCLSLIVGLSLFYFGFFRPGWFSKKAMHQKPSFKDDSYFWKIFPYGLFFMASGLFYTANPSPTNLLIALGCSAWVQILNKYV